MHRLPLAKEIVAVTISREEEYGYFVTLPAYDNAEGLILRRSGKEGRRQRFLIKKSLPDKDGNFSQLSATVLRVDNKKGFMDLEFTSW